MNRYPFGGGHGSSILETLLVWCVGAIALVVLFGLLVELVVPLLPWLGAVTAAVVVVRWWLLRTGDWQ